MDVIPSVETDAGKQEALPVVIINPNGTLSGVAMTPLGYQQMALTLGTVYTVTAPANASMALIKPEAGDIRYRDDGVDPSATVGMPIMEGESLYYDVKMSTLKVTAQEAGAICNLAFYGEIG